MILVCGEALIDFFPFGQTEALKTEDLSLAFNGKPGGSPFNVAFGLARQEVPVSFLSVLSTDLFGRELRRFLEKEGVDLSLLGQSDRPTTLAFVQTGPDGVPHYAFIGDHAADRTLTEETLPPVLPPHIRALSFGSFSLAVEPCGTAYEALMRREWQQRVIALDPNVRLRLIDDPDRYRARLERLLGYAAIVKVSTEDLETLYGAVPAESIARHWQARGPFLIVVTDGPNGACTLLEETWTHYPGKTIAVADTVGAGDTFQASLLAGLAKTGQLERQALKDMTQERLAPIIERAIQAAAITCTRCGADLPYVHNLPLL